MLKLNFACSIPKMHYRSIDRSLCFLAFLLLRVPDSPYNIPHKNVYFVLLLLPCMSLSVSSLSNTHTPDRGPTNHYDLHLNVAHTSFHQAVRSLEAAEQPSHHSLASQNRGDNTDWRLVACNIWRPEFRAAASRTKPTTLEIKLRHQCFLKSEMLSVWAPVRSWNLLASSYINCKRIFKKI